MEHERNSMQTLVFIGDDKTELDAFGGFVEGHYDCTTVHFPDCRA
jgi:hypothetical protein